jgi:hypothetical protein
MMALLGASELIMSTLRIATSAAAAGRVPDRNGTAD